MDKLPESSTVCNQTDNDGLLVDFSCADLKKGNCYVDRKTTNDYYHNSADVNCDTFSVGKSATTNQGPPNSVLHLDRLDPTHQQ